MVASRAGLGFTVAVVTGLVVEWMHRKYGHTMLTNMIGDKAAADSEDEEAEDGSLSLGKHLGHVTETALHDFVDITVFLIIGALIAAFAKVIVPAQEIAEVSKDRPTWAIAIMMAFAFVVTLCSEADAFVAANFTTLRPAAKIAFLVLGPMLDFKLFFMYTRIFRRRLMWAIIFCVVIQVFVYSYILHQLWERNWPTIRMEATPASTATK